MDTHRHRDEMRRYRWRKMRKAGREPHVCQDCGEPVWFRNGWRHYDARDHVASPVRLDAWEWLMADLAADEAA